MTQASDQTLELLRGKLRVQMNDIGDDIITGACRNHEDYRYLTGIIDGLVRAERELLDLDERLEHE